MNDIKPCPFCGGKCDPEGWSGGDGRRGPECEDCGATADSVDAWNLRSNPIGTAEFLIKKWVEENGIPMPWAGAIRVTAIVTRMPDSERDALLALDAGG